MVGGGGNIVWGVKQYIVHSQPFGFRAQLFKINDIIS